MTTSNAHVITTHGGSGSGSDTTNLRLSASLHNGGHGSASGTPTNVDPLALDGTSVIRTSLKLFNAMPEHLPPTLHEALQNITTGAAGSYLSYNARPGCVHITMEAVVSAEEAERLKGGGASGLLTTALAQGKRLLPAHLVGTRTISSTDTSMHNIVTAPVVAQVENQVAAVGPSGITACLSTDQQTFVCGVVPLALLPTRSMSNTVTTFAATVDDASVTTTTASPPPPPPPLFLLGRGITGPQDLIVCRRGEVTPDLGVLRTGASVTLQLPTPTPTPTQAPLDKASYVAQGLAAGEYVQFEIYNLHEGLHMVEVQNGSILSPPAPFLVVDDEEVVAELRQLEVDGRCVTNISEFVQWVGIVLDHLRLRDTNPRHPNASDEAAARIEPLAARIVAVAAARGWPALLRWVALATTPAKVDEIFTHPAWASTTGSPGISMLHLAAGSGSVEVIEVLAEWGAVVGHVWTCRTTTQVAGVTPLHVAALLDDGATMAMALTALLGSQARRAWFESGSGSGGLTPAQIAKISCNEAVEEFLSELRSEGSDWEGEEAWGVGGSDAQVGPSSSSAAAAAAGGGGVRSTTTTTTTREKDGLMEKSKKLMDSFIRPDWPYRNLTTQTLTALMANGGARTTVAYSATAAVSVATAVLAVAVRLYCGSVQ